MGQAIFGLVGVLVGGLVTAGVQWLNRWLEVRDRRRVATRLLKSELRRNLPVLRHAMRTKKWWSEGEITTQTLVEYRAELAHVLTDGDWDAAESLHETLTTLREKREADIVAGGNDPHPRWVLRGIRLTENLLTSLGVEPEPWRDDPRPPIPQVEAPRVTGIDMVRRSAAF